MAIETKKRFKWNSDTLGPAVFEEKNVNDIIKIINHLPNPYVGNKKKLLSDLNLFLNKNNIHFDSVLDAFSGSGAVGLFFKLLGKRVIANDLLTSSYFNAVALIENNNTTLSKEQIDYILNNPDDSCDFVRRMWTSGSNNTKLRQRFTEKEAIQLDRIRANIKNIANETAQKIGLSANQIVCMRVPFGFIDRSVDIYSHRKKQMIKYGSGSENHDRRIGIYYDENLDLNFKKWFPKYVSSINNAVIESNSAKYSHALSIFGVQNYIFDEAFNGGRLNSGQVLKNPKLRIKEYGEIAFANLKKSFHSEISKNSQSHCIATNCDIIELLRSGYVNVDCVYFDPPYGGDSSNYFDLYQFFEEYVYEDVDENLPHRELMNRFVKRKNYEQNFLEMLDAAKDIPCWIFSYNDKSWESIEHIRSLIERFRKHIIVDNVEYKYKYRKNTNIKGTEYIICARN